MKRGAFKHMPQVALTGPFVTGLDPALLSNLAFTLPFMRWRLAEALGLEKHEDIAESLLFFVGTIYASLSHIDVVLPLEKASAEVRRAGLDLDPGWLPAFGRVVQFHYE